MTTRTAEQLRVLKKAVIIDGTPCTMRVWVRHDDQCNNGHNTFSITASITGRGIDMGGCLHEEVAEHFPELAPLIKWHLCSTDGPMHYIANTVFLAGDRDPWGLRKGEVNARSGRTGTGKDRELARARRSAIWPDATDEELMSDDLPRRLEDRLPALLDEFRAAVEGFGFTY